MADYKDIINGTIGNIVGKVKEVANSDKVRDIYEQGTARAKNYGRIAKLTLELNGDHEELKRVYTEIGKLYFDQSKYAPEGFFAPLFAQAGELIDRIITKEDEIAALKAESEAPAEVQDIEVEIVETTMDFDDIVSATEDEAHPLDPED